MGQHTLGSNFDERGPRPLSVFAPFVGICNGNHLALKLVHCSLRALVIYIFNHVNALDHFTV